MAEARESAATTRAEAEDRARGLLEDARATADGVRVRRARAGSNLREMSNSLRANAERLLGDVQRIHSSLTAQIARVERASGIGSGSGSGSFDGLSARSQPRAPRRRQRSLPADDGLDVPEFIPPS